MSVGSPLPIRIGSKPSRAKPAKIPCSRCSFAVARADASRPENASSLVSPVSGSRRTAARRRSRGRTAPRSGPGRRPGRRPSRAPGAAPTPAARAASTKSERTKTKRPGGEADACRSSVGGRARASRQPRAAPAAGPDAASRRSTAGGGQKQPSAAVLERRRPRRAPPPSLAPIASAAAVDGRGLVEPRRRRPEEPHARAPVDHDRDPGRRVGEELADDELVRPARGRQAGRRAPVDPGPTVARPVRPRADDLVALARGGAAVPAEADADEAPARDERKGRRAAGAHGPPDAFPPPSPAAAAARGRGSAPSTAPRSAPSSDSALTARRRRAQPVPDTGSKRPLDVVGDDERPPLRRAPTRAPSRSSERLARTDAPTSTARASRVARTSSTAQRLSSGSM